MPCGVGLAALDQLQERRVVERVRERGLTLHRELKRAVAGLSTVKEVRGKGFLPGIELVDPRDGNSYFPMS